MSNAITQTIAGMKPYLPKTYGEVEKEGEALLHQKLTNQKSQMEIDAANKLLKDTQDVEGVVKKHFNPQTPGLDPISGEALPATPELSIEDKHKNTYADLMKLGTATADGMTITTRCKVCGKTWINEY